MDTEKLLEELKRDEGLRRKPYECSAGKLTIGYGRNLEDKGITNLEAEYLLNNDVFIAKKDAWDIFDIPVGEWDTLTDARQRVIVNMIFNLGVNRFKQFKRFIAAVKAKDYPLAAKEMINSKWYRQVGARASRLVKMMMDG